MAWDWPRSHLKGRGSPSLKNIYTVWIKDTIEITILTITMAVENLKACDFEIYAVLF